MKKYLPVLLLILTAVTLTAQDLKSERQINLEKQLMAPCCYGGAIYDHESGVADQMKRDIAIMIKDGKSDDEILAHYEAEYGEKILATPKAKGFNLAAWWVPAVLGILALLGYILYTLTMKTRKLSGVADADVSADVPEASLDISSIIDRELDEFKKNN